MKTLNGKEAIQFGFQAVTSNFLFFLGIVAIIFICNFFIPNMIFGDTAHGRGLVGHLVVWIISAYAALGFASIGLRTVDKKSVSYQDFFGVTRFFAPYVVATIVVQIATTVGVILLIVPGVIVAIMWMFYSYLILDKNLQPMEALKQSALMTKGHRWQLFGFGIFLLFINIIGGLLFGLGLIITAPVTVVAVAHMYRQLS